jgi:hypothetical protein
MRTFFVTMVAIALLVTACLFGACVSEKPANQTPVLNSTTQVPEPTPTPELQLSPYITYDEAKSRLGEYLVTDPLVNPDQVKMYKKTGENITVQFVQGINLNTAGDARVWTFGTRTQNGTQLRALDRSTGWTIIALNEAIPSGDINLDNVVSPSAVFSQNKEKIFGSDTEVRQIELKDGVYSVTIGRPPGTIQYNATTGAPIETNS